MRIPSFVPLVESERRKRELVGLLAEVFLWAYSVVVLGRLIFAQLIMVWIEDFAFDEKNPAAWAKQIVDLTGIDSRYPGFAWSTLGLLALVGGFIGLAVGISGRGFGSWIASISKIQVNNPEDSLRIHKHWAYARKEGVWFLLLTIASGWIVTKVSLVKLSEIDGLQSMGRLILQLSCGVPLLGAPIFEVLQALLNGVVYLLNAFRSIFGMNPLEWFEVVCVPTEAQYYSTALSKLSESIYLAFMATFFAVPVAFVLAFFAARNLTRYSPILRGAYMLVRIYMNVTRSIEPIIWAILFSVWIGIGPFAGSIALMIHSISSLVKQYSEAIESVDPGPIEALEATGANRIAIAWFAVVPQVILPYLAFTIYRWDINVRMATVIGLVGGGGIGGLLIQEQGLSHWTQVGTIAFLIFLVVWGMDFLSARIREAIQ